jgi:uncharacterized protein
MTLFLDTTALLALHVDRDAAQIFEQEMRDDATWVACAVALAEAVSSINQMSDDLEVHEELEDNIRRLWDYLYVVPVDQACLDRASEITRDQPIRIADALHLAAADRLPKPVRYCTLDAAQIPVALALGFQVISPQT